LVGGKNKEYFMNKFNKTAPTKTIDVPVLAMIKGEKDPVLETVKLVGVERVPLIIHRSFNNVDDLEVIRGVWQITHVFTGYNLGVFGSYKFCRAVGNELLDEPLLYLPSQTMMTSHADFRDLGTRLNDMRLEHWHLGGKTSRFRE
jgi:hypothetical protein